MSSPISVADAVISASGLMEWDITTDEGIVAAKGIK